jgi:hypothetical protein
MAKNSIRDYANTAASNTDVQSQNIDEGCSPAGINNAIREVMADLADVNDGTVSLVSPDFNSATLGVYPDAGRSIDAFPSGTKMLFQQTAAPTGWTKDTTHNDKALRVVSGTVGSGGTSAFSTAFDSYTPAGSVSVTVAEHTLLLTQIPSHSHDIEVAGTATSSTRNRIAYTNRSETSFIGTETAGGGLGHGHPNSTGSFTGTASTQFDVQYVDLIIATKS